VVSKQRNPKNPTSILGVVLQGGSSSSRFSIWDPPKEFLPGGFESKFERRVSYDQIEWSTDDRRFSYFDIALGVGEFEIIPTTRFCMLATCEQAHYAGRTTKFALVKVSDSPNSFSEFFFSNSVLLCSFLWAVEWIHDSPPFSFFN